MKGVQVRRFRVLLPKKANTFWRIVFDSSVGLTSLVNALGVARPDFILAVVPTLQNAYSGGLLARFWRVPLVLLVKDLPLEAGLSVGMLRKGALYRLGLRFERHVYSNASRIVVIGDAFKDALQAKGVDTQAIEVISDWIDTDRFRPQAPPVERSSAEAPTKFVVVHAGTMGEKQHLETVVDAAAILTSDSSVEIALVGDGPARPGLAAAITKGRLRNISMPGIQPADELIRLLGGADLLLINQCTEIVDAVVPSKLLTYMAVGRPILAAVNSASVAAKLVHEAQCGLIVPPEDPTALANGIKRLQRAPDLCNELGQRGRLYVERHYGRTAVLARWDRLLQSRLGLHGSSAVSST